MQLGMVMRCCSGMSVDKALGLGWFAAAVGLSLGDLNGLELVALRFKGGRSDAGVGRLASETLVHNA